MAAEVAGTVASYIGTFKDEFYDLFFGPHYPPRPGDPDFVGPVQPNNPGPPPVECPIPTFPPGGQNGDSGSTGTADAIDPNAIGFLVSTS